MRWRIGCAHIGVNFHRPLEEIDRINKEHVKTDKQDMTVAKRTSPQIDDKGFTGKQIQKNIYPNGSATDDNEQKLCEWIDG